MRCLAISRKHIQKMMLCQHRSVLLKMTFKTFYKRLGIPIGFGFSQLAQSIGLNLTRPLPGNFVFFADRLESFFLSALKTISLLQHIPHPPRRESFKKRLGRVLWANR